MLRFSKERRSHSNHPGMPARPHGAGSCRPRHPALPAHRGVVLLQADALPEVLGRVRTLYGLDVQVAAAAILADGGVPAVGQWTGAAVAQPSHIVIIPAKVLGLGLCPEAAVPVIYELPNHLCMGWKRGRQVRSRAGRAWCSVGGGHQPGCAGVPGPPPPPTHTRTFHNSQPPQKAPVPNISNQQ